jgi:translation initiation factor IF-3
LAAKVKINHEIKAPELRVIDETNGNLGVLTLSQALAKAEELGLDLIEISPLVVPPVAKIMDFGKYQYLQNKKTKPPKKGQGEIKTIQIKIGTGDHDLQIKANKVSEFMERGQRVKIDLFLPGRAKYMDNKFLQERLERLLKFITTKYKIADAPKKGPRGMSLIVDKAS